MDLLPKLNDTNIARQAVTNLRIARLFLIWSGLLLVFGMLIAQVPLMHFIPPPPPSSSAEEIAQRFIAQKNEIRLGCLIMIICWALWATWSVPIVLLIRTMEGRFFPVLTYVSLVLVGGAVVFFEFIPMTWAVIAFRPESLAPGVIQIMNDWVWFDYLFNWPTFSLWCVVIAVAIFNDKNTPAMFPRWVAYLNIWGAIGFAPVSFLIFFKTGPLAYDGLIAFWLPFPVFFAWILFMTVLSAKALKRKEIRILGQLPGIRESH